MGLKKILVLNNEAEAMLIDSLLNERKIPHILKSYHDVVYDGIFQNQKGWGCIEADIKYKEEILGIYEDIVNNPDNYIDDYD